MNSWNPKVCKSSEEHPFLEVLSFTQASKLRNDLTSTLENIWKLEKQLNWNDAKAQADMHDHMYQQSCKWDNHMVEEYDVEDTPVDIMV